MCTCVHEYTKHSFISKFFNGLLSQFLYIHVADTLWLPFNAILSRSSLITKLWEASCMLAQKAENPQGNVYHWRISFVPGAWCKHLHNDSLFFKSFHGALENIITWRQDKILFLWRRAGWDTLHHVRQWFTKHSPNCSNNVPAAAWNITWPSSIFFLQGLVRERGRLIIHSSMTVSPGNKEEQTLCIDYLRALPSHLFAKTVWKSLDVLNTAEPGIKSGGISVSQIQYL